MALKEQSLSNIFSAKSTISDIHECYEGMKNICYSIPCLFAGRVEENAETVKEVKGEVLLE